MYYQEAEKYKKAYDLLWKMNRKREALWTLGKYKLF